MNPLPTTSVVFTELRPTKPSQRNIALGIVAGVALMLLDFYVLKYGIWLMVPFVAMIRFFSWWQQRNDRITFYADHLLISKEGKKITLPYTTVEAIEPNTEQDFATTDFFTVTRAEDQLLIDTKGYDKVAVWNAFQTHLPTALAKGAFVFTTRFQRELQIAEKLLDRDGVLKVFSGFPTIWRAFTIITFVVGIALSIGIRDFIGIGCMGIFTLIGALFWVRSGNIEISRDGIVYQNVFRRWQIRWDEIEIVKTDFTSKITFGNAEKWLTIPVASRWSGENKSAASVFLAFQVERRAITPQQSKMPLLLGSTKNTLVPIPSKK